MTDPVDAGLVVVDKAAGMTSHDVVARVRRLAGTRKVGHAGTLDPMATGVLLLGVNRATRLLGHLMLTEKAYDATVRLGAGSSTDDAEGELGPVGLDRAPHRGRRPLRGRRLRRHPPAGPVRGLGDQGRRAAGLRPGPGRRGRAAGVPRGHRARARRHRRTPRGRVGRRGPLGALQQRHLRPGDRPRPRRRARHRGAPHRAAPHRGGTVHPRRRPHPRRPRRRVRDGRHLRRRPALLPVLRPRRRRRPAT